MQISLGAVYAWSVFRVPLTKAFGWSAAQVTLTFTIAIFALGFASFFGGLWLNQKGPRIVAMTGGLLYGLGVFLASFSDHKLWWLYLSYGVIGGTGLGLGYIVPIFVLVKWFQDRRGLLTGIAVGGFGAGALVVGLHPDRRFTYLAVVGPLAALVLEYLGENFADLAGIADISGVGSCHRHRGSVSERIAPDRGRYGHLHHSGGNSAAAEHRLTTFQGRIHSLFAAK